MSLIGTANIIEKHCHSTLLPIKHKMNGQSGLTPLLLKAPDRYVSAELDLVKQLRFVPVPSSQRSKAPQIQLQGTTLKPDFLLSDWGRLQSLPSSNHVPQSLPTYCLRNTYLFSYFSFSLAIHDHHPLRCSIFCIFAPVLKWWSRGTSKPPHDGNHSQLPAGPDDAWDMLGAATAGMRPKAEVEAGQT